MDGASALTFDDFVAPMTADVFLRDVVGQRFVHLASSSNADRRLLTWAELNRVLAVRGHWSDLHLSLVMDGVRVPRERYCDLTHTLRGPEWRADPAKVQAFAAQGATLIGNMAEDASPELKRAAEVISAVVGGMVSANIYASFRGVQGFGPHYDTTDVYAFQCEGEKVWRIYEGRALNPVNLRAGSEREMRERERDAAGGVAAEVTMRPGDLLYIPRGWYHDALTQDDASLHVTFATTQLTGRALMRALDQLTLQDAAFRAGIPDASAGDEDGFRRHLQMLADRLRDLAVAPDIAGELRRQQRALRVFAPAYALPVREPVRRFRANSGTELIDAPPAMRVGRALVPVQGLEPVALWLAGVSEFTDLECYARFSVIERAPLTRLIEMLVKAGAVTEILT